MSRKILDTMRRNGSLPMVRALRRADNTGIDGTVFIYRRKLLFSESDEGEITLHYRPDLIPIPAMHTAMLLGCMEIMNSTYDLQWDGSDIKLSEDQFFMLLSVLMTKMYEETNQWKNMSTLMEIATHLNMMPLMKESVVPVLLDKKDRSIGCNSYLGRILFDGEFSLKHAELGVSTLYFPDAREVFSEELIDEFDNTYACHAEDAGISIDLVNGRRPLAISKALRTVLSFPYMKGKEYSDPYEVVEDYVRAEYAPPTLLIPQYHKHNYPKYDPVPWQEITQRMDNE